MILATGTVTAFHANPDGHSHAQWGTPPSFSFSNGPLGSCFNNMQADVWDEYFTVSNVGNTAFWTVTLTVSIYQWSGVRGPLVNTVSATLNNVPPGGFASTTFPVSVIYTNWNGSPSCAGTYEIFRFMTDGTTSSSLSVVD